MRYRDGHEEPEGGRDAQRSGATEQSSGIATSGIGVRRTLRESKTASSLCRSTRGPRKQRVARDDGPRQVPREFGKMRNGVLGTRHQV